MARPPSDVYIRLPSSRHKATVTRVRFPWRQRKRRTTIRRSSVEKAALKLQREEKQSKITDALLEARAVMWELAVKMHEDFPGHSARYYYNLIMQRARRRENPRKMSLWNAFVSQETARKNAECGDDEDRVRVSSDYIKVLSARWQAMTPEERVEAVGNGVEELTERRQNRKEGVHNVNVASFNDVRATLSSVTKELELLNQRTQTDILLMAVRSKPDQYNRPFLFYTNERIPQYIVAATGGTETLKQIAMRIEAACIGGVDEVIQSRSEELGTLKKRTAKLILTKLQQVCVRGKIGKMFYTNFDEHVTLQHGVVIDNWPEHLAFRPPGLINTVAELDYIYKRWDTGETSFRSLTNTEWREWVSEYRAKEGDDPGDNVEEEDSAGNNRVSPSPLNSTAALPPPPSNSAPPPSTSTPPPSTSAPPPATSALPPPPSTSVPPSAPATSSPAPATSAPPPPPSPPPTQPPPGTSAPPSSSVAASSTPENAAPALANAPPDGALGTSTGTAPRGKKRPRSQTMQFFNAVTAADGSGIVIPKRVRKERCDKHTKRGPRGKKKGNDQNTTDTAAEAGGSGA